MSEDTKEAYGEWDFAIANFIAAGLTVISAPWWCFALIGCAGIADTLIWKRKQQAGA